MLGRAVLAKQPHKFDGVRDAIDAVSDFESRTVEAYDYEIVMVRDGSDGYIVTLEFSYGRELAGFLGVDLTAP